MHGDGDRRFCPTCGQGVLHIRDTLSHRELQGPRHITPSNIDRCFDDNGRFLFIEEKRPGEPMKEGQKRALQALSKFHDVWVVVGTPDELSIYHTRPDGFYLMEAGVDWDVYQERVARWFN